MLKLYHLRKLVNLKVSKMIQRKLVLEQKLIFKERFSVFLVNIIIHHINKEIKVYQEQFI